jgi:hypothetical protein
MPDITMCPGTNCPHKEKCYRFTAKPSDYQAYFIEPPIKFGKCYAYWGDTQSQIWNQLQDIVKKKE